ncbi:MAG TPA: hypothetical protein DEB24_06945 [Coriobacteriia bacterium]|nr:hypothetical protein [Coriobacteriia bacterium]
MPGSVFLRDGYRQDCVKTIYGKVIKTTEEPFPGSLATANELESVVGEPMRLSFGEDFDIVIYGELGSDLKGLRVDLG